MNNSLSKRASDWREGRRLRAWELKGEGWSQQKIANALGVSKGAVSQWMKRAREGGVEGLKRTIATGAPPRLSEKQRAELPELLAKGAPAHGFRGEVWTCERVAEVSQARPLPDPRQATAHLGWLAHTPLESRKRVSSRRRCFSGATRTVARLRS